MKVEFEVTRKTVIEALLERHRLTNSGGPVPKPSSREELWGWVKRALRAHGDALWVSVDEAPMKAVTEAVEIVDELFPELKPPCSACKGGFPLEYERAPCCGRKRS